MIRIEGFETVKVGNQIDVINVEEMLRSFPFCSQCDLWDLYKFGNVDLIHILDSLELTNKYKYISVNMMVQFLSPRTTPAPRGNWHFDANGFDEDKESHIHLLVSNATSLTEFMTNDIVLEQFDKHTPMDQVEIYLNRNLQLFKPVSILPNHFITFNGAKHLHRAVRPKNHEFRFTLRVLESNFVAPRRFSQAVTNVSDVYDDGMTDLSQVTEEYIRNNTTKTYVSIERSNKQCIVYSN